MVSVRYFRLYVPSLGPNHDLSQNTHSPDVLQGSLHPLTSKTDSQVIQGLSIITAMVAMDISHRMAALKLP